MWRLTNRSFVATLLLPGLLCTSCRRVEVKPEHLRTGLFFAVFGGASSTPQHMSSHIAYDLVPGNEQYLLYVPASYTGSEPFGLIVFTYSDPKARLPVGWQTVLDARKYIFVAAKNAGNDQPEARRLGLAVMGAMKVLNMYRIDPDRVYAAGFSGGARMAGLLGFYQSDIFRGTLQNCGADFYRPVPLDQATSQVDNVGKPYGLLDASDNDVLHARETRFALITGTNDFRRGNILDIFHGGFERDRFKAKLFDVSGMGHDICDGVTLARALDFLESGS